MLALSEKCIHPTSQKPYIKSFSGGKNNSPEGYAVNRPSIHIPTITNVPAGSAYAWLRGRVRECRRPRLLCGQGPCSSGVRQVRRRCGQWCKGGGLRARKDVVTSSIVCIHDCKCYCLFNAEYATPHDAEWSIMNMEKGIMTR
jgi:hypothetical protein